jgi:CheY-like chemotaxis protein
MAGECFCHDALDTEVIANSRRTDAPGMRVASTQGMDPRQASSQPTTGEQDTFGLGVRPMLLIVDDDDDVRALISNLLHAGGYAVLEARDGADALDQLRAAARLPVAILTDLSMPGVDGWQLIERVRKDPRLFAIPVVVISSSLSLPTGVCCLRKPVGREALMRALTGLGVSASSYGGDHP